MNIMSHLKKITNSLTFSVCSEKAWMISGIISLVAMAQIYLALCKTTNLHQIMKELLEGYLGTTKIFFPQCISNWVYFYEIIIIRVRYFATKLKLDLLYVICKARFWVLVFTNCQTELVHSDEWNKQILYSELSKTHYGETTGFATSMKWYICMPFYYLFYLPPPPHNILSEASKWTLLAVGLSSQLSQNTGSQHDNEPIRVEMNSLMLM